MASNVSRWGFIPFASQRPTKQERMHSKKFCCCFPVRIGVFVLSLFSLAISAASAWAVWYTVVRTAKYGTVDDNFSNLNSTNINDTNTNSIVNSLNGILLDPAQYHAFIVIAVILSIYALVSLFGFLGAVFRRRVMVSFYSSLLWLLLFFNLGAGIYMSWSTAKQQSALEAQCAANHYDPSSGTIATGENKLSEEACAASSKLRLILYILSFCVQWLIQLYCCVIVRRYVEQLSDEQAYKSNLEAHGSYYAHHELGPYPYGQAENSFGTKA